MIPDIGNGFESILSKIYRRRFRRTWSLISWILGRILVRPDYFKDGVLLRDFRLETVHDVCWSKIFIAFVSAIKFSLL